MQWLITLTMGLWAVWTWAQTQERERMTERSRIAALYVNPFLSACEDLQSRIYHILERDGLRTLRARYPDGSYAEETLYLIARYFGWAAAMSRYSPYAQDRVVIRLVEDVRAAFATTDAAFPVGPFNFFHAEQKALGKLVMSRMEGEHGAELDTISSYEFRERLASAALTDSQAVQQSLAALRAGEDVRALPGRRRLEAAQRSLVDLLHYIEEREGYTLFPGERRKCSGPPSPVAASRARRGRPARSASRGARPGRPGATSPIRVVGASAGGLRRRASH